MINGKALILIVAGLFTLLPGLMILPFLDVQICSAQPAPVSEQPAKSPITFKGGPGDTPETAVIITGAPNSMAGIAAEYQYLGKKFGPRNQFWKLKRQSVMKQNGRIYDRLELELKGGRKQTIFFDISGFFGKL